MPRVVVVAHAPTSATAALRDAVLDGLRHPDLEGAVEAVERPALEATADDVLGADALVLLTPVNFGYLSGALKHFFDSTYGALRGRTDALPFLAVVKGTTDASGAVRALDQITTGLRWRAARPHVVHEGDVDDALLERVREAAAGAGGRGRPGGRVQWRNPELNPATSQAAEVAQ